MKRSRRETRTRNECIRQNTYAKSVVLQAAARHHDWQVHHHVWKGFVSYVKYAYKNKCKLSSILAYQSNVQRVQSVLYSSMLVPVDMGADDELRQHEFCGFTDGLAFLRTCRFLCADGSYKELDSSIELVSESDLRSALETKSIDGKRIDR